MHVTLGAGVKNPRGNRIAHRDAAHLAEILRSHPARNEGWWSQHVWKNDRRSAGAWEGASGVAIDVDYYDAAGKHAPLRDDVAAELERRPLPGNLFHLTPRGARLVFVFAAMETDRARYAHRAEACVRRVEDAIEGLGGPRVDAKVSLDLARLLYLPNAIVDDAERSAEIRVLSRVPLTYDDERGNVIQWSDVHAPSTASRMKEASRRYNADHPKDYPPAGTGDCPVCAHHGCFGVLRADPTRWGCFSTNHASVGVKAPWGWHGDALDIDAFLAGVAPVEHLRRTGYLLVPAEAPRVAASSGNAAPAEVVDLGSAPGAPERARGNRRPADDRPVIVVGPQADEVTDAAVAALTRVPVVYQRGARWLKWYASRRTRRTSREPGRRASPISASPGCPTSCPVQRGG